jgi:hypothetical protein
VLFSSHFHEVEIDYGFFSFSFKAGGIDKKMTEGQAKI